MGFPFEQRSRLVVHRDMPHDVYIGRGRNTRWGNPFSHQVNTLARFKVATREQAVYSYAKWLMAQADLLAEVPTLKGKILGCWCDRHRGDFNPEWHLCHGHVLAWLANPGAFP